jgi:hypothetical protein
LWITPLLGAPAAAPLSADPDWKADPAWLDARRLVYLSDRDARRVGVWQYDLATGRAARLFDDDADVSAIWMSPVAGEFVYRSSAGGSPDLWLWWGPNRPQVRLTRDPSGRPALEEAFAFSPDGQTAAFISRRPEQSEVVLFDMVGHEAIARVTTPAPAKHLTVLSPQEALIELGGGLYRWRPGRRAGDALSERIDWGGVEISGLRRLGADRWALVADGRLLLVADRLDRLDRSTVYARGREEMAFIALAILERGDERTARATVEQLWTEASRSPESVAPIGALRGWLERRRGRFEAADRRLEEVLNRLGADDDAAPLWLERLSIGLFERADKGEYWRVKGRAPAPLAERALVRWMEDLLERDDPFAVDYWRDLATAARARDWPRAAEAALRVVETDAASRFHRRGFALLLRGEFEPLAAVAPSFPLGSSMEALYEQPAFQEALLRLADADLDEDFTRAELRGQLLLRWAELNQRRAARALAAVDLRDPDGPTLDYLDMLDRFLDPEEQERWMERAVGDVFLDDDLAAMLEARMTDPRQRLVFRLAQAKDALIDGDARTLDAALVEIDLEIEAVEALEDDPVDARLLLLARLYAAKRDERRRDWDGARRGYDAAFEILDRHPRDWGVVAFDLSWARAALDFAPKDDELLHLYLQIGRGLGDPLVNPSHDEATLATGLSNIHTLRPFAEAEWIGLHLDYLEAGILFELGHVEEALLLAERAAAEAAPAELRRRAIFELAAIRGSLGQHRLAGLHLSDLADLKPAAPQLAATLAARAQAEVESGLAASLQGRLRELCRQYDLEERWARVLVDLP